MATSTSTMKTFLQCPPNEEVSEADGTFVMDVLSMYRDIEHFKANNTGTPVTWGAWSSFAGFDGNNETNLHVSDAVYDRGARDVRSSCRIKAGTTAIIRRCRLIGQW